MQFVTSVRENGDRPLGVFNRSEDQRARDYSGAAGKRFVFHASLIGADGDFVGTAYLDEVHVGAAGQKHFVITNRRAFATYIHIIEVQHWNHYMRHAAVDKVNGLLFIGGA